MRKTKPKKPALTIIEDTREQTPLTEWPEGVAVENGTLHTGDYSIKGWENCFTVERKTLEDFAGTMMGGYEAHSEKPKKRFNRELERMRHYDLAAVFQTLTRPEFEIVAHLLNGGTMIGYAEAHGLTKQTAFARIKALFKARPVFRAIANGGLGRGKGGRKPTERAKYQPDLFDLKGC